MERIDLAWEYGKHPHLRWESGTSGGWTAAHVTLGQLDDGRWYAQRISPRARGDEKAYVFGAGGQGEADARRMADDWMGEGEWRPVPASFGPDAQPADGRQWIKRGSAWFLAE